MSIWLQLLGRITGVLSVYIGMGWGCVFSEIKL